MTTRFRFWTLAALAMVWLEILGIAVFGGRDMIQPGNTRRLENLSGLIEVGYPVALAALATVTAVLAFKRLLPGFGNRAAAGLVFACLAQAALLMPLIGTRAVDLIGNTDYDELRPGEGVILSTDAAERWFSFEQSWLNPNQIAPILLASSLVTILFRLASTVAVRPELKNVTLSTD